MDEMIVLKIFDKDYVDLNGMKLRSTNEAAEALEKLSAEYPDMTVSIEAGDSIFYEAISKAIYGSQRVGFSGDRCRILIDGKPLETSSRLPV